MTTAYIEKHTSYEVLNGPSGQGLSDFYAPDCDVKAQIVDGQLQNYSRGVKISKDPACSEAYDDLRLTALMNQIQGKDSTGTRNPGVPAIFGMNFIAVNTAQKALGYDTGITLDGQGNEVVGGVIHNALQHTDASVGKVLQALHDTGLDKSTLVVLTAKNGDAPRIGAATLEPTYNIPAALASAGIQVAHATQDDVGLFWLANQSQASQAASLLLTLNSSYQFHIASVLTGSSLTAAGFANPLSDDRSPDLVVQFDPGIVISDSSKRGEHGGFSEDDTHVPLILGGGIPDALMGTTITDPVMQQQIAVTTADALGLDASLLQGAVIDGTRALPVPEPGSTALMLFGCAAMLMRRRRRA